MSERPLREKRCETCRFWQKMEYDPPPNETEEQRKDRLENQDMMSECHIRSVPSSYFPKRGSDEWCGEWAGPLGTCGN